jgi:Flp pilus assembly protein TadB
MENLYVIIAALSMITVVMAFRIWLFKHQEKRRRERARNARKIKRI